MPKKKKQSNPKRIEKTKHRLKVKRDKAKAALKRAKKQALKISLVNKICKFISENDSDFLRALIREQSSQAAITLPTPAAPTPAAPTPAAPTPAAPTPAAPTPAAPTPNDSEVANLYGGTGLMALREFFGIAGRFLLPQKHWNDTNPQTKFEAHSYIKQIHRGFNSWGLDDWTEMVEGKFEILTDVQRIFDRNPNASLSGREGREIFTKLRKCVLSAMKEEPGEKPGKYGSGIRLYQNILVNKYYPKGKKAQLELGLE